MAQINGSALCRTCCYSSASVPRAQLFVPVNRGLENCCFRDVRVLMVACSLARRSYYKCTSSRCCAKKHVEKCVDDPEMLIVTYEGPHLHGPQPPFPRRQWAPADFFVSGAAAAAESKAKAPSPPAGASSGGAHANPLHTWHGAEARGGVVACELRGVTATRSCDGGSTASVAAHPGGTALPCDSPPTTWSCPDFCYSAAWSPEALLP